MTACVCAKYAQGLPARARRRTMPFRMRTLTLCVGLACVIVAPSAIAQLDTTRRAVVVRAGPDSAFPQVARLPNASNLRVFGCTAGRQWCDILSGRTRGWIPPSDLSQSSRLRDAPTLTFSVENYWNAHYRTRAWFSSMERWSDWGTPGFVPPTAR